MGDKVLCQALPDLLRKTILTFCEGSVKFERKLEVIGSVHVRSDSEKVVTFLLDEQVYRYNNGPKKEKEEKVEPQDYSIKRQAEDETKSGKEQQRFVVPKKRKLQRPMRHSCYGYSQENSDDESEVDFRTSNGERVSRDGIVFSPPRMIRRLQDFTDNTDSNASLSSDETYRIENIKTENHAHGDSSSHIHDRYRVPLGADTGHSSEFNADDSLHINLNNNSDNNDDAVFERRSRSTMLLTSNFQDIVRDQSAREEDSRRTERCTSTEVTSTKPDDALMNSNDTAATSPASDNDEGSTSQAAQAQDQPNQDKSSPSTPHSAQFDHVTTSASIDNLLPKLAEATASPQSSDILHIADSNMNYQAATASILQTPFSLAQSLAYPYMSLPFLQYSLPQTLMALTPPVSSLPAVTTPNTTTVQSQTYTSTSPKGQSSQSPTNQQGPQAQASPSNSDSWDRAVPCRECGKMLKSERMLELHMNTAHTHKTVYPCKQCGKIFYAASSLHSHKKRTHTSLENKFKCPNCVRFYAFQSELLRHIDTAHMPLSRGSSSTNSTVQGGSSRSLLTYNNTQVPIQSKVTLNGSQSEDVKQETEQSTAANHINGIKKEEGNEDSQDTEYRFKCQQCGQKLKSRECLNLHINAKHTQKHAYPCNYCDKVFYAPSSRFCHVRRVHASKEQKFCCDYCDKVCTFHYELRNHIKLSHKDKALPDPMLPDSATHVKEVAEAGKIQQGGENG